MDLKNLKNMVALKSVLTNMKWRPEECEVFIKKYGREIFLYAMAFLNPQKAHPILSNFFNYENECKSISTKEARGDFQNKDGKCIERKSSFSLKDNGQKEFNIVQIRPFQQHIDLYNLYFIEFFPDIKEILFEIDAKSFYKIVQMRWSPAHTSGNINHGDKPNLEEITNKRIEMRITIQKYGDEWNEFEKYKVGPR